MFSVYLILFYIPFVDGFFYKSIVSGHANQTVTYPRATAVPIGDLKTNATPIVSITMGEAARCTAAIVVISLGVTRGYLFLLSVGTCITLAILAGLGVGAAIEATLFGVMSFIRGATLAASLEEAVGNLASLVGRLATSSVVKLLAGSLLGVISGLLKWLPRSVVGAIEGAVNVLAGFAVLFIVLVVGYFVIIPTVPYLLMRSRQRVATTPNTPCMSTPQPATAPDISTRVTTALSYVGKGCASARRGIAALRPCPDAVTSPVAIVQPVPFRIVDPPLQSWVALVRGQPWSEQQKQLLLGRSRPLLTSVYIPSDLCGRLAGVYLKAMHEGGTRLAAKAVAACLERGKNAAVRVAAAEIGQIGDVVTIGEGRHRHLSGPLHRHEKWLKEISKGRCKGVLRDLAGVDEINAVDVSADDLDSLFPRAAKRGPSPPSEIHLRKHGVSSLRYLTSGTDKKAWTARVWRVIKGKSADVTGGPSGLRYAHLEQLAAISAVEDATADGVDALAAGKEAAMYNTVRLTLLKKPAGGLRPIGVGEAHAQIAKKIGCDILDDAMVGKMTESGQWVSVVDACRAIASNAQQALTGVLDAVLVTTDVTNAFNSVERKNVLDAAEWALQGSESAAEILELVRYGLQPGTIVLSDGSQRTMDRGVVQGDPTSATLFGTWMAYVLHSVKQSHPDTIAFLRPGGASAAELLRRGKTVIWAYADDVAFLGRNEADIWAAHATFRDLLAAGGQQLCDAKTEVVASRLVVDASGQLISEVKKAALVLGVPVGVETDAIAGLLRARLAKARTRVDLIGQLPGPISRLIVSRMAGVFAKVSWVWQAVCEEARAAVRSELDALEHYALAVILGIDVAEVTDEAYAIASLPVQLGGLGLRSVSRWMDAQSPAIGTAASTDRLEAAERAAVATLVAGWREQGGERGVYMIRRQASVEKAKAWCWLMPGSLGSMLDGGRSADEESCLLRRWLALPTMQRSSDGQACPGGHKGISVDRLSSLPHADHVIKCCSLTTTQRHDAVAMAVFDAVKARMPSGQVRREQAVGPGGGPVPRQRGAAAAGRTAPGDVTMKVSVGGGQRDIFVDVVVRAASSLTPMSDRETAVAATAYVDKMDQHRALCSRGAKEDATDVERLDAERRLGIDFVPFAMDSWGGLDSRSESAMMRLFGDMRLVNEVHAAAARALVLAQGRADRLVNIRMAAQQASRPRSGDEQVETRTLSEPAAIIALDPTPPTTIIPLPQSGPTDAPVAASRWLVPLIHAAAIKQGEARDGSIAASVQEAAASYEAFCSADGDDSLPRWDELLHTVHEIRQLTAERGSKWPRGSTAALRGSPGYIQPAVQERVLGLVNGSLPDALLAVTRWITATRLSPPSVSGQLPLASPSSTQSRHDDASRQVTPTVTTAAVASTSCRATRSTRNNGRGGRGRRGGGRGRAA